MEGNENHSAKKVRKISKPLKVFLIVCFHISIGVVVFAILFSLAVLIAGPSGAGIEKDIMVKERYVLLLLAIAVCAAGISLWLFRIIDEKNDEVKQGMITKACPKCGKQYDDSWKVCLKCRQQLTEIDTKKGTF